MGLCCQHIVECQEEDTDHDCLFTYFLAQFPHTCVVLAHSLRSALAQNRADHLERYPFMHLLCLGSRDQVFACWFVSALYCACEMLFLYSRVGKADCTVHGKSVHRRQSSVSAR